MNAEQNPAGLPAKLLEKLVCPKSKQKLEYDQERNRLVCRSEGVAFRIEDGIPVLLMDETEPI